jgi:carbon monoxide dehydrogenase subunit G
MTVKVNIDLNRKFSVTASIDTVFTLLSDVPASGAHFPKVDAITKLSDSVYRWEMEKVNLGASSVQTSYACKYTSNSEAKTIEWTPIKGEGNSTVWGIWELTENGEGTDIAFKTKAELKLPLPGLLKLAVSPLVKMEFSGMVDTYLGNLKRFLA